MTSVFSAIFAAHDPVGIEDPDLDVLDAALGQNVADFDGLLHGSIVRDRRRGGGTIVARREARLDACRFAWCGGIRTLGAGVSGRKYQGLGAGVSGS